MRRVSLLIVASVLLLSLAVPAMAQEPSEVTVFFHSGRGAERDALDQILTNFNDSQDDYVAVATELPEGSYTDSVNAAALAGELACLLDFDGPTLYSFAWRGYLTPIDDFVSEILTGDILQSILDQGTYNDQLYSLGVFDSGLSIWGNRALLEEAGVRIPEGVGDEWTFEEFQAAIEALQALDGVEFALDLKMDWPRRMVYLRIRTLYPELGGDLINREDYQSSEGVLNGEAAVAAMEWFQNLFEEGYTTATPADDNLFIDGKSALSWVGHWEFNRYSDALGDDLVLIPMPDFGNGPRRAWDLELGYLQPMRESEGAWDLLEFMLQPDQMTIMTDANGAVPSRVSVLEADENYAMGGPLQVYFDQLNGGVAVPRPVTLAYPVITAEFAKAADEIAGGADVQDALDAAVDAIELDIETNDGYPVE